MAKFYTYNEIISGKVPEDFGVSEVKGSSLTIPGQGQDLVSIIASIVKLPPIDDRDYDSPAGVEPDIRSLAVKTELDSLYGPEASNAAEDANERKEARKNAKEQAERDAKLDNEQSEAEGAKE